MLFRKCPKASPFRPYVGQHWEEATPRDLVASPESLTRAVRATLQSCGGRQGGAFLWRRGKLQCSPKKPWLDKRETIATGCMPGTPSLKGETGKGCPLRARWLPSDNRPWTPLICSSSSSWVTAELALPRGHRVCVCVCACVCVEERRLATPDDPFAATWERAPLVPKSSTPGGAPRPCSKGSQVAATSEGTPKKSLPALQKAALRAQHSQL